MHKTANILNKLPKSQQPRAKRMLQDIWMVETRNDAEAAIEARLREAIEDARATGSAIAIGHPRPATLAAVRSVAPQAAADGVELTLASALVH